MPRSGWNSPKQLEVAALRCVLGQQAARWNGAGTPSRMKSSSPYPAFRSAAVSFSSPAFTGPSV